MRAICVTFEGHLRMSIEYPNYTAVSCNGMGGERGCHSYWRFFFHDFLLSIIRVSIHVDDADTSVSAKDRDSQSRSLIYDARLECRLEKKSYNFVAKCAISILMHNDRPNGFLDERCRIILQKGVV